MYMPDFDYYSPASVEQACALLDRLGPEALVLAGGTDLLHKMKLGKLSPRSLVSLKKIKELKGLRHVPGCGVIIGAATTHSELMESTLLHRRHFSVSDAAHQMASNQIRNLGTVGGNLVNGVPSADLPPILIALEATIKLVGSAGIREMALEEFFVEPAATIIRHGELLTEITLPDGPWTGSRYIKFGLRRSGALAVVGAAAAVVHEDGIIRKARIVLSSSAPKVIRATEAEAYLAGREPTREVLKEAARLVSAQARPRDSIRGSAEYRRNLAGVLGRRALQKAIETGHGSPDTKGA